MKNARIYKHTQKNLPLASVFFSLCPCLFFFSFCMRFFEVEKIYCGYSDDVQTKTNNITCGSYIDIVKTYFNKRCYLCFNYGF